MEEATEHEDSKADLKTILHTAKEYINIRIQIVRLNITEKIALALSSIITGATVAILYLLAFIFASFALCYWLGRVFKNTEIGFICGAGIFVCIGLIIHFISKASLNRLLTDKFIDNFSKDDDDKEFEEQ